MELKIDAARWQSKRGMGRLLEALGAEEGLTRYVGGSVRDELLHLPISDVDLATKLKPDEVLESLEAARIRAVPTGIDHGTITAVSSGSAYEVTTLRRDVSTDGRRATVAFTDDWEEDAARRDFTINALSADPVTGHVFDYFGGKEDLLAHRVRFIGNPLERIAEDHLRILRFFRFHARFGKGEPEAEGLAACAQRANDLMALSRERIADELLKLLAADDPTPTIGVMLDHDILLPVLPEIEIASVPRLQALIEAERDAGVDGTALRRMAALLPPDPPTAERIAVRLKLSNKARKRLGCAANADLSGGSKSLAYYHGRECAIDRLLLAGQVVPASDLANWNAPRLSVGGGDLIARGLRQGPEVAKTLQAIERRWVEAGFPTGEDLEAIINEQLANRSN